MGKTDSNTLRFYEEEAEIYDETRFSSEFGKYLDAVQKKIVLGMCEYDDKEILLDIGTGTGRFVMELVGKGAISTGTDVSGRMIKTAKKKAVERRVYERVNLVRADACTLPFRNASFDGCISINVLNHVSDYNRALSEVARILKPRGYFVANFPNMQGIFLPVALFVKFRQRALFRQVYSKWFTLKEMKEAISNAGLRTESIKGCLMSTTLGLSRKTIISLLKHVNRLFIFLPWKYLSGVLYVRSRRAG